MQGWRAPLSCTPWRNNLTPVIKARSCILHPCASHLHEAGSTSPGPHSLGPSARSRPVSPFHVKPSRFGLAERCPAPDANGILPLVITKINHFKHLLLWVLGPFLLFLLSIIFPILFVSDVCVYVFLCIFQLLSSLELFSSSFVGVCDSFSLLLNLSNNSACWPPLVLRQMWPPPAWLL